MLHLIIHVPFNHSFILPHRQEAVNLNEKLDAVEFQLQSSILSRQSEIKSAAKIARIEERQRYSKMLASQRTNVEALTSRVSDLSARSATSDLKRKSAERQAIRSSRRSDDVMEYTKALENQIRELEADAKQRVQHQMELEMQLMEKEDELQALQLASPIKVFGKNRGNRKGGASSWLLFVWELILEQLVNGTPPTSVNSNIVSFIQRFSPQTIIKELPSIWTIRRGRTVLLVIVQTLAAYRLARAKKWGQLHTDGTGRRQIALQDLVLSIEEDVEGLFE